MLVCDDLSFVPFPLLIHIKVSHTKRNPSSLLDLEGRKRGVEEYRLTDHKLYFKIYCFDL